MRWHPSKHSRAGERWLYRWTDGTGQQWACIAYDPVAEKVLKALAEADGEASPRALVEAMGLTEGQVLKALATLVAVDCVVVLWTSYWKTGRDEHKRLPFHRARRAESAPDQFSPGRDSIQRWIWEPNGQRGGPGAVGRVRRPRVDREPPRGHSGPARPRRTPRRRPAPNGRPVPGSAADLREIERNLTR